MNCSTLNDSTKTFICRILQTGDSPMNKAGALVGYLSQLNPEISDKKEYLDKFHSYIEDDQSIDNTLENIYKIFTEKAHIL